MGISRKILICTCVVVAAAAGIVAIANSSANSSVVHVLTTYCFEQSCDITVQGDSQGSLAWCDDDLYCGVPVTLETSTKKFVGKMVRVEEGGNVATITVSVMGKQLTKETDIVTGTLTRN